MFPIYSFVLKPNKRDGTVWPTFQLDSWEDLSHPPLRIPPGKPFFGVHIHLKNAFCSFRLPPRPGEFFPFSRA